MDTYDQGLRDSVTKSFHTTDWVVVVVVDTRTLFTFKSPRWGLEDLLSEDLRLESLDIKLFGRFPKTLYGVTLWWWDFLK